jgi:hypothetical protein
MIVMLKNDVANRATSRYKLYHITSCFNIGIALKYYVGLLQMNAKRLVTGGTARIKKAIHFKILKILW